LNVPVQVPSTAARTRAKNPGGIVHFVVADAGDLDVTGAAVEA